MKKKLKEGAMSELDILAQESSTFESFLQRVKQEFPQIAADLNNAGARKFLEDLYNNSKDVMESKLDIKRIIREELAAALGEQSNPELDKMVDPFVKGLASKYAYQPSDAVMAIFEALKRLNMIDKTVNYKAAMGVSEVVQNEATIYDLIGQPLEDLGVKLDEMVRTIKDPKWIAAAKIIKSSLDQLIVMVDKTDKKLGIIPMAE